MAFLEKSYLNEEVNCLTLPPQLVFPDIYIYVCVCVCVRERERERERYGKKEGGKEKLRKERDMMIRMGWRQIER